MAAKADQPTSNGFSLTDKQQFRQRDAGTVDIPFALTIYSALRQAQTAMAFSV